MTIDFDKLVGGYAIEQEDRAGLVATSSTPRYANFGDLPENVDPRKHLLWDQGLLKVENQGSIGSCQGASLSECGEFCYALVTSRVLQFSKMFSYIESQKFDGIRTDSGSTLSGGTKAAMQRGFCPESIAPYPSRYPGWSWVTQAMLSEAQKYKLQSHTTIRQESEVKSYIGSGLGIVHIGISWNRSMTPDSGGFIRSFSAGGGGGHAVVFCGYLTDAVVGKQSTKGYWYILKNSWGQRWGVDGFAFVDPAAITQMLGHQWSVFIGRSDMKGDDLVPRPLPVDFTKPGKSMYA
jgi:C1A family cysteine protease